MNITEFKSYLYSLNNKKLAEIADAVTNITNDANMGKIKELFSKYEFFQLLDEKTSIGILESFIWDEMRNRLIRN